MDTFFYRCIQLADLLHTEPTNIDYGAWRGMPVTVTAPAWHWKQPGGRIVPLGETYTAALATAQRLGRRQ
jgi:hypothetical protein